MDSQTPPASGPAPKASQAPVERPGGESVCWAYLVCAECGAMTTEGHRPGCQSASTAR